MKEIRFIYLKKKNISVKFGWKVKQGGRCGERREDKRRKILFRAFNALCGNFCSGCPLLFFANHSHSEAYLEFFREG